MRFRDDRIIKVEHVSFEHAFIVQGIIIYAFMLPLIVLGTIQGDCLAIVALAGLLILTSIYVAYYSGKKHSFKKGLKVGLLKILVLLSSSI